MNKWTITASKAEFDAIKADAEFRAVVKLARAANAVTFCNELVVQDRDNDSPSAQRTRMNAFLYIGPVLYEGIELVRTTLGKDLRNYSAFQKHFVPLFKDAAVSSLKEDRLKKMRNEGVFHFTADAIPDALIGLDRPNIDFTIGEGDTVVGAYHLLADEAVIHAGFDAGGSKEDVYRAIQPLLREAAALSARFSQGAEELIAEVLIAKGWRLEEVPGPSDEQLP